MDAQTFTVLRGLVAEDLGPSGQFAISDAASAPDAARWAICRATSGSYLRSDGGDPSRLVGHYAYVMTNANLGQSRLIVRYAPELGAVGFDEPLGTALTASDTIFVSSPFPAIRKSAVIGLRELINDYAMRYLLVSVSVPVAVVDQARQYDLTSLRMLLDRPERIEGLTVYDPPRATGAPYLETDKAWEMRFATGGVATLVLHDSGWRARTTGKSWAFLGQFPARSWINDAVSSDGFVADTDTSVVDPKDLVRAVRPFAHRAIGLGMVPGFTDQERAVHRGLYAETLQDARAMPTWDHLADQGASRLPDRLGDDRREAA